MIHEVVEEASGYSFPTSPCHQRVRPRRATYFRGSRPASTRQVHACNAQSTAVKLSSRVSHLKSLKTIFTFISISESLSVSLAISTPVSICLCLHAYMHVCMYACMHVCMHVCMHACMHACMYVCMYVCLHMHDPGSAGPAPPGGLVGGLSLFCGAVWFEVWVCFRHLYLGSSTSSPP